jgi:LacI family transcriptional regulator
MEDRATRHVALLVETSNAYARGILAGVRDFVSDNPHWSIYLAEHGRRETNFSWLEGWRGHGMLARLENTASARLVRRLGVPTVDLSAKRLAPELPCVETDDVQIVQTALQHFRDRGISSFAFCGDSQFGWSLARANAFVAELGQRGTRAHRFDLNSPGTRAQVRQRLGAWLSSLPHPVGVVACYDIAGQEVLEACSLAGLSVPDEVAVIGVDNDELYCNLTSPPLSSIQPDAVRTGLLAAQLLEAMMNGVDVPAEVHRIPATRVAVRQSSDIVAVSDPLVAAAVKFIRDQSDRAITVDEVLRTFAVSRRSLDDRFNRFVRRSVHTEIVRARLSRVAHLLATTDWTMPQIADKLDFAHAEYMGVMFKKSYGQSPGAYRQLVVQQRV